jgi:hypothetical protein
MLTCGIASVSQDDLAKFSETNSGADHDRSVQEPSPDLLAEVAGIMLGTATVTVAAVPETTGLTTFLVAGQVAALSGEHMK